jgi:hypothetical protein
MDMRMGTDMRLRRLTTIASAGAVCLVLLTVSLPAEPMDPLQAASAVMGVRRLTSVRFEAFGAAYAHDRSHMAIEAAPRVVLKRYDAAFDYDAMHARVRRVRDDGDVELERPSLVEIRRQLWSTPHGFLRAARARKAATRRVLLGVEVTFDLEGRRYVGVLNAQNEVDRVQTWVESPAGQVLVETLYRDYEPVAGGGRFPTHIVQRQDGQVALDIWVSKVEAGVMAE